jgi:hypothetical protein
MKLRAQMLNHRLPLAPQPLTDHPAAVSFVWTLLKNLCRSSVVGNYRLQDIQLSNSPKVERPTESAYRLRPRAMVRPRAKRWWRIPGSNR